MQYCGALLVVLLFFTGSLSWAWAAGSLTEQLQRPDLFPVAVIEDNLDTPGGLSAHVERYSIINQSFIGPMANSYFRIHLNRAAEPIGWSEHNPVASNVYFHLLKAIRYFSVLRANRMESFSPPTNPAIIRIGMDVDFALWIKYSNLPKYNASVTVPDPEPDHWGTPLEQDEIWFHIAKRKYLPDWIPTRWVPKLNETVFGTAGFPLDSALVPTIIYHEYVHLATKAFLGIHFTTALNEGIADYFGSVIGGRPRMGKLDEFSNFPYAHDYREPPFRSEAQNLKRPSTFLPKFLWSLRREYGAKFTDMLVYEAVTKMTPKSSVKDFLEVLYRLNRTEDLRRRIDYCIGQ